MPFTLFWKIVRRPIRGSARRKARTKAPTRGVFSRGRKEFALHKEVARERAVRRLEYFNQFYGFTYGRISIRNQKTRWGSCSTKGNLNFNYKLALLPDHLADYLVVHELCHLGEFNHSRKFWDLVGKTIPDYVAHREELRTWKRTV